LNHSVGNKVKWLYRGEQDTKDDSLILRLTIPVLVRGEAFTFPSPCGVNCSYSTQFEGPYLECNTTSITYNKASTHVDEYSIYSASWSDPQSSTNTESCHEGYCSPYNGTYSIGTFNFTTLTPLLMDNPNTTGASVSVLIREDQLSCFPARANYTVNNTYINNIHVHTRTISTEPIDRLINLAPTSHNSEVIVPGFLSKTYFTYGTTPANWSAYATTYYRDMNHISLIESMMYYLNGTSTARIQSPGDTSLDTPNKSAPPPPPTDGKITYGLVWDQPVHVDNTGSKSTWNFSKSEVSLLRVVAFLSGSAPTKIVVPEISC
jgi:hypothetical protein